MGTGISGILEHYDQQLAAWIPSADLILPRDYAMFGLLANVRGAGAPYSPRGFPDNASAHACRRYWYMVLDAPEGAGEWPHSMVRRDAERAVSEGYARWRDGTHRFISAPDWHTPSWLTTGEYHRIIALHRAISSSGLPSGDDPRTGSLASSQRSAAIIDAPWRILLGAMEAGEEHVVPMRFIFWFDN